MENGRDMGVSRMEGLWMLLGIKGEYGCGDRGDKNVV